MKHFLNKCSRLLLLCLFCIGSVNAQQACDDIPIDDFSESAVSPISTTNPLIEVLDDGGSGVNGQFRGITIEILEGPGLVLVVIDTDTLIVDNSGGVISRSSFLYDAGGSGLNLNLATSELVNVTLLNNDNGINITFVLTDENSNQATQTQSIPAGEPSGPDPLQVEFLFDDFSGIDSIDLSAIDSVEFILQSDTVSTDTAFGGIGFGCRGTLPEFVAVPTLTGAGYAVLVLLVLLLAIWGLRRASA